MVATQPPTAGAAGERIAPLEGVRGLMAWWVVLGHLSHTLGLELFLISQNTLAVDVFIILSGFVITGLIVKRREAYVPYITRRAFRIFPAYLVVLAISALLLPIYAQAMIDIPFVNDRNASRLEQAQAALSNLPAHLATHIPLLQGLVPNGVLPKAAYTIVGQAWSVSLEWQFYLVAPLIVFGISRRKLWPLLGLGVLGLLALRPFMSGAYLGGAVFPFGVGIASYYLYSGVGRMKWIAAAAAGVFALGGLALDGVMQIVPLAIWAASLVVIMGAARWRAVKAAHDILSSSVLRYIGDRSYSVYLVHMIPLYLGVSILNGMALSPVTYGVLLLAGMVAGTGVLSEISYRGIERPFIKLGASVAKRMN